MKKFLLSLICIATFLFSKAQGVVLNEFYPNPGFANNDPTKFNHEYFELYNTTGSAVSLDCYTLMAYDNVNHTAFVYQFQNGLSIPSGGFLVFTSSVTNPLTIRTDNLNNPVTYSGSNIVSWNQTDGTTGFLKAYSLSGIAPNRTLSATAPGTNLTNVNDFLLDPSSGQGIAIFLFNGGTLVNGFIGNGSPTIPSDFATITNFVIPATTSCGAVNFNLSQITNSQVELQSVTAATGNDNGYYRTTNGLCGTWKKSANADATTPGESNGSNVASDFATVTATSGCNNQTGQVTWSNISIKINNTIYNPSTYAIYEDLDGDNQIDATDNLLYGIAPNNTINDLVVHNFPNVTISGQNALMIRVTAQQNCLIFFRAFQIECINLPVSFKSFNATRIAASNVSITWTTASEQNNRGFNVQKNVGGEWKTVAFVPSQALGGNSSSDLSYSFKDVNTEKGITQYRIQQVDLDGMAKYSDIKAIRGENTVGKLVVYPNPSVDGKLNVVFEDNFSLRDVYVSDMQGKIIRSYRNISNNILVIEKLTSGFYTIKVTNRNTAASSVEKVIVK